MPMSYFYGKKFVGPITPLIKQIRQEIYNEPYEEIKWWKVRHLCAKVSLLILDRFQIVLILCGSTKRSSFGYG